MSEWIEWTGGDCPVPPDTPVEIRLRDGWIDRSDVAAGWVWGNDGCSADIVAYRVLEPASQNTAKDIQIGGSHYKDMAIQPVEFITANKLGFCEGNAVKYLCRWQKKGGVEDLKKARHYIDLLIEQQNK